MSLRIDDDAGHRRLHLKELEFASDSAGNVKARISKAPPTVEELKDVEHLKALYASIKVPTLCRSCGTNLDYNQCFCKPIEANPVANTCELGEHCRCKNFDVAYQQDCWNWMGGAK